MVSCKLETVAKEHSSLYWVESGASRYFVPISFRYRQRFLLETSIHKLDYIALWLLVSAICSCAHYSAVLPQARRSHADAISKWCEIVIEEGRFFMLV
jgi:hypothetical protein